MKFQNKILIWTVFLMSFSTINFAQINSKASKEKFEIGSETFEFKSKFNGKDYKLYINLPDSYKADSSKKYPVLYKLDAQWSFGGTVSLYGNLRYDGYTPEMIIVGISYGGENPNYGKLRGEDLTPTKIDYMPGSGGAPKFQEVLRKEIIPLVDKGYRTNKIQRALSGTSLGGLFTWYSLFTANDIFNKFIICNPSFWWEGDYIFRLEKEFSGKNKDLKASVFMGSGEYDAITPFNKAFEQVKSRNYKSLNIEKGIYNSMGHSSAEPQANLDGLIHVFKKPYIKLSEKELKVYTGKYTSPFGGNLKMIIKDGHLAFEDLFGNPNTIFYPISKTEFSFCGSHHECKFNFDDKGNVTGLDLEFFNNEKFSSKKIK